MFRSNAIAPCALLLTGVAAVLLLSGCYGHASDVPDQQDTQAVRTRAAEVPLNRYFFVRSGSHFAAIMVDSQTEAIDASPAQISYSVTPWDSEKNKWGPPEKKAAVGGGKWALLDAGPGTVGWTASTASGSLSAVPQASGQPVQVALCNLDDISDRNPTTGRWHYGYL